MHRRSRCRERIPPGPWTFPNSICVSPLRPSDLFYGRGMCGRHGRAESDRHDQAARGSRDNLIYTPGLLFGVSEEIVGRCPSRTRPCARMQSMATKVGPGMARCNVYRNATRERFMQISRFATPFAYRLHRHDQCSGPTRSCPIGKPPVRFARFTYSRKSRAIVVSTSPSADGRFRRMLPLHVRSRPTTVRTRHRSGILPTAGYNS